MTDEADAYARAFTGLMFKRGFENEQRLFDFGRLVGRVAQSEFSAGVFPQPFIVPSRSVVELLIDGRTVILQRARALAPDDSDVLIAGYLACPRPKL